jgi:hypothetical protein
MAKGKKTRFKYILHFIFLCGIMGVLFLILLRSQKNQNLPSITGPLQVENGVIFDVSHKKIYLRGINYSELTPYGYVYQKPDVEKIPLECRNWIAPPTPLNAKQVKEWGFNVVRLVINWDQLEPLTPVILPDGTYHHQWNKKYLDALDNAVTAVSKNHIAVILDMHQFGWSYAFKNVSNPQNLICGGSGIPSWLYPNPKKFNSRQANCEFITGIKDPDMPIDPVVGFGDVWQFIAERYKNNPSVVAADILNEPWVGDSDVCSAKDLKLDIFYTRIGNIIRRANPGLLLIFEDRLGFEDKEFMLQNKPPFQNSVYSVHIYSEDWSSVGNKLIQKYFDRARVWNIPLFIGEFDAFTGSMNPEYPLKHPDWQKETSDMLSYFKENGIHWTFWAYSGQQSLLKSPGIEVKEDLLEILQKGF